MSIHRISYVKRGSDDWGSGAFAASRGSRLHKGRDYLCDPGAAIRAPMEGRIVRIGFPYSGEEYRLVELLSGAVLWRFFYVAPAVAPGAFVPALTIIGHSQDIGKKYVRGDREPMPNHVHVECILDPDAFFNFADAVQDTGGDQLWA